MSCPSPLTWETLVDYWAGDLTSQASALVEEHLFGCEPCSTEAGRVAAVTEAVRAVIPPVVSRPRLERLRAQGKRITENDFVPGVRCDVVFPGDVDLLIHRLGGLDLHDAERVDLRMTSESTGELLVKLDAVPYEPTEAAVLIACQRHYAALPPDPVMTIIVHARGAVIRTADYTLLHIFA